jgi:hypothetical protein
MDRRNLTKLGGLSHLLRPDPRKTDTAKAFNAHIDRICGVLQGLKIEGDSNAPAPVPEQIEMPEPEAKPKRKAKDKPNRMHEGGEDRDDPA